jgi:hypothetical protein
MGDPIIIWLPGTVLDYSGACQAYADYYYDGLHAGACGIEDDGMGDGGVYVTCCFGAG